MKIAIVGRMAAGKTTLANLISDIVTDDVVKLSMAGQVKAIANYLFKMQDKDRPLLQQIGMKMREIKTLPKPIKYINFWDSTNVQTLNSGTGYFIEFAYGGTKDSSILIPYKKVTVKDSLIVKVVKIKKQQPTPK